MTDPRYDRSSPLWLRAALLPNSSVHPSRVPLGCSATTKTTTTMVAIPNFRSADLSDKLDRRRQSRPADCSVPDHATVEQQHRSLATGSWHGVKREPFASKRSAVSMMHAQVERCRRCGGPKRGVPVASIHDPSMIHPSSSRHQPGRSGAMPSTEHLAPTQ